LEISYASNNIIWRYFIFAIESERNITATGVSGEGKLKSRPSIDALYLQLASAVFRTPNPANNETASEVFSVVLAHCWE